MCRYIAQYLEGRYQCCNRRIVSIKPNICAAERWMWIHIVVDFSAAPDLSIVSYTAGRSWYPCFSLSVRLLLSSLFVCINSSITPPCSLPAAQWPTLPAVTGTVCQGKLVTVVTGELLVTEYGEVTHRHWAVITLCVLHHRHPAHRYQSPPPSLDRYNNCVDNSLLSETLTNQVLTW